MTVLLKEEFTDSMTDEEFAEAYSSLYEQYASRGMRYAQTLLGNESDAEEAVQEAFCRLLSPFRERRPAPSPRAFGGTFFRTLRNLSIDCLRRRQHRDHVPLSDLPEPPVARDAEGLASRDDSWLERAMERIPRQQLEALGLRVDGALSYDEIASIMDCTRAQVRTWIFRARRQLALELERSRKDSRWTDVKSTPNC
ncbi:MAG: RNA polymerase sigma factor [Planctomycetota bacterium]